MLWRSHAQQTVNTDIVCTIVWGNKNRSKSCWHKRNVCYCKKAAASFSKVAAPRKHRYFFLDKSSFNPIFSPLQQRPPCCCKVWYSHFLIKNEVLWQWYAFFIRFHIFWSLRGLNFVGAKGPIWFSFVWQSFFRLLFLCIAAIVDVCVCLYALCEKRKSPKSKFSLENFQTQLNLCHVLGITNMQSLSWSFSASGSEVLLILNHTPCI